MILENNPFRATAPLIVSNSCGLGHIQAAAYVKENLRDTNAPTQTRSLDIYKSTLGSFLGDRIAKHWAKKQQSGDVQGLNNLLAFQWIDHCLAPILITPIFFYAMHQNRIDTVITVQPIGVKGILTAARIENFIRKMFYPHLAQIQVKMVLTELPTCKTVNFFTPLKWLSDQDREIFQLMTTHPLLETDQDTETLFWKRNCNLEATNIVYLESSNLPVRTPFRTQEPSSRKTTLTFTIPKKETSFDVSKNKPSLLDKESSTISFPIQQEDFVATIRLGGNANATATEEYIKSLVEDAKKKNPQKHYIFVLCGSQSGPGSLYEKLLNFKKEPDFPENCILVPLALQDAEAVAHLVSRSDLDIVKSGGSTSLELMALNFKGSLFIHAGTAPSLTDTESEETLLEKGMPQWESGNALFLKQKLRARITSPTLFKQQLNR